jgi:hypothetical protein
LLIGAVAGLLVVAFEEVFQGFLHIDDVCNAATVHGVCGLWGVLANGLFASSRLLSKARGDYPKEFGLIMGGNGRFLGVQLVRLSLCSASYKTVEILNILFCHSILARRLIVGVVGNVYGDSDHIAAQLRAHFARRAGSRAGGRVRARDAHARRTRRHRVVVRL